MIYYPGVVDTVGLEIEGTIKTRAEVLELLSCYGPFNEEGTAGEKSPVRRVYRDASVESIMSLPDTSGNKLFLGNPILRNVSERRGMYQVTTGFELITKPMPLSVTRDFLDYVLPKLASGGEIFSPRASIHVHTGFPSILSALRTAVSIGLRFEGLFYKLAGLGNEYRGSINHSIYAKPLAIPPVVQLGTTGFARLAPEKAQFAESLPEFWNCFALRVGSNNRYHPARYFGLNVYSTQLIDTIEFRYFNLCLNPKFVTSVVALCQLVAELALLCDQKDILDEKGINILEDNTIAVYEDALQRLIMLGRKYDVGCTVSNDDVYNLMDIMQCTPDVKFTNENVLTHTNYVHSGSRAVGDDVLVRVPSGSVIKSGHVDIHNFFDTGERSILD